MKFERKIKEFDPSSFKGDPFKEVDRSKDEGSFDKSAEKMGEILGYTIIGIILGIAIRIFLGT